MKKSALSIVDVISAHRLFSKRRLFCLKFGS